MRRRRDAPAASGSGEAASKPVEPLVGEGYNHGWCTRLAGASTMDRRLGFLFVALAAVIHGSLGVISKGLLNVAATNGCVS